jgi:hypothetical protein
MADEITVAGRISIKKGNLEQVFAPSTLLVDLASENAVGGNQVIGTNPESLVYNSTDVAANGYAYFRNLSTSATITLNHATSTTAYTAFVRLEPGEFAIHRVASTSIHAQASTTTAVLQYLILSP